MLIEIYCMLCNRWLTGCPANFTESHIAAICQAHLKSRTHGLYVLWEKKNKKQICARWRYSRIIDGNPFSARCQGNHAISTPQREFQKSNENLFAVNWILFSSYINIRLQLIAPFDYPYFSNTPQYWWMSKAMCREQQQQILRQCKLKTWCWLFDGDFFQGNDMTMKMAFNQRSFHVLWA